MKEEWMEYIIQNKDHPFIKRFDLNRLNPNQKKLLKRFAKRHHLQFIEQFEKITGDNVLVIIPTFNAKDTILESVNSVLNQTHRNITLVVVDDCSKQNVKRILKGKDLIYYKLNKNVGTYNAINYVLSKHQDFDYFIIHGADDIMSPINIEEHLKGFTYGINAVSTGYRRIDYDTKQIISEHYVGDSMVMYNRHVFNKLGYYDNTRFGGDTEYHRRYLLYFKKTYDTKQILTDAYLFNNKKNLTKIINEEIRNCYIKNCYITHQQMIKNNKYKVDINNIVLNILMKELKGDFKISVNLATYPKREDSLLKVLNNLLEYNFIDNIRIYLNEYKRVPFKFPKNKKILYHIGKDNLKDSGKFFWSGDFKNEYYFTIDDDLLYSKEYFIKHLKTLKEYNNDIFLTTHGKILKENPKSFLDIKEDYPCLKSLKNDKWINNPGTGVMVFDNSKFIIPLSLFEYHGMCDLWVGVYSQLYNIPILCRKHNKDELYYIEQEDTLFDRRDELKDEHSKVLNLVNNWELKNKY